MAFIREKECTIKQMAYAKRILGGQGKNKKQIALDSGYSSAVSNSVSSHIEQKKGFQNAMTMLALDSNNLALAAMSEFKARGFKGFSNKELVGALNAIGSAWSKFNAQPKEKEASASGNKLRNIVMQQIENQNIITKGSSPSPTGEKGNTSSSPVGVVDVSDPMDF